MFPLAHNCACDFQRIEGFSEDYWSYSMHSYLLRQWRNQAISGKKEKKKSFYSYSVEHRIFIPTTALLYIPLQLLFLWSLKSDSQVAVLSVLFLTGLGMILVLLGDLIRDVDQGKGDFSEDYWEFKPRVPAWLRLQFGGALIAALFWVRECLFT